MRSLLCLLLLLAFPAPAQDDDGTSILEWNEFYFLSWSDFEGTPGPAAIGDAGASVQIMAQPYRVRKEVRYDVYAYFNRAKSWSRGQSPALLAHEQLHFDIAELYARKIRKLVDSLKNDGVNDIVFYNDAIRELLEESNDFDRLYDIETLHGALTKKQTEWAERVRSELMRLENYKKRKRIISPK